MPVEVRLAMLAEVMNLHPLEATVLPALIDKCLEKQSLITDKHKFISECFDNKELQRYLKGIATDVAISEYGSNENIEVVYV